MTTRFRVHAQHESSTLVRLLDLFVLRGIMLSQVHASSVNDDLYVIIDASHVDTSLAERLAARMENMIAVISVRIEANNQQDDVVTQETVMSTCD